MQQSAMFLSSSCPPDWSDYALKLWRGGGTPRAFEGQNVDAWVSPALTVSPRGPGCSLRARAIDHGGEIFKHRRLEGAGLRMASQRRRTARGGGVAAIPALSVTRVEGSSPTLRRYGIVAFHQLCRVRCVALRNGLENFDVVLDRLRAASGGLEVAAADEAGHQIQ